MGCVAAAGSARAAAASAKPSWGVQGAGFIRGGLRHRDAAALCPPPRMGCIAAGASAAPSWGVRATLSPLGAEMGGRLRRRGAAVLCPPPRGGPRLSPTNNMRTWCEEEGREDLLEEWADPNKGPDEVTRASTTAKVQWKCGKVECGWTWYATVYNRTRSVRPSGCPACAGKVPTPTHNLEVWCKEQGQERLLEEWADPDEAPKDFTPGSKVKVPWKCGKCGCGWDATVHHRTRSERPTGCPACAGRKGHQVAST